MTDRKGIGGPKTAEGKKRVSMNALRHGFYAETPQALEEIAQEIGQSYQDVLNDMRTYYFPRDVVQDTLVKRIARCAWRMMLIEAMEDRAIGRSGLKPSIGPSREKLMRYERLADIQLHRAMDALEKRQEAENKKPGNKLAQPGFPRSSHAQTEGEFVPSKKPNPGTR